MGKIVVTLEHTGPSNTFLSNLAKRREPFAAYMIDRGSREVTARRLPMLDPQGRR